MDNNDVDLLAIGAGPSNLALAVAVEEMAPADLASRTLIIEQHESVAWQRGMLLPWTQSQVSFLKDLVTLRNPRSKFSFVSYLHANGRLDDFINMSHFLPYRLEISDYLSWVAKSLSTVQIEYGRRCVNIEPIHEATGLTGWAVELSDGSTIRAANLAIGVGREPHIPEVFRDLPCERLIHSSQYSVRAATLEPQTALRAVVVGAAQSAAEMLWETHQRWPSAQCTMVMRTIGLNYYQTSKFTNELYFPSFTDQFFNSPSDARSRILQEMRYTNYAGVTPGMLETIYQQMYLERLSGTERLRMVTMTDVEDATMDGDDVVLTLSNHMTGRTDELRCDVVMLGTGFERRMPPLARAVAKAAGAEELTVNRSYRMILPPPATAGCYLQGTNEESHGIADSLISVIAIRAGEIVTDLLAHRTSPHLLGAGMPQPALVSTAVSTASNPGANDGHPQPRS
jgi:L-ornithine N5-monooxygenase